MRGPAPEQTVPMITAVPWDVFVALVALEFAIIVVLRVGWSALGSLRPTAQRVPVRRVSVGTE